MILDSIRSFLKKCPYLDEFARGINVDYLSDKTTSYSLNEVVVNPIIKKYVDGSSIRQYAFLFTSREAYGQDVLQNLDNIGFYEKFANWLEESSANKDLPILENGRSMKIEATTIGYLFDANSDNAKYQIQCRLTYFKEAI